MIYKGKKLKEIVFPLGGIGTGSVGLSGNGALVDWEIFNRPNKGSINPYTGFFVKAEYPDGRTVVKVLQGDHQKDLSGQYQKATYRGFGHGPANGTMAGLPHFETVTFESKFPFATLTFEDTGFPAKITMKAFNPFVPLDADASGIPSAFFDIKIHSREDGVKYTVMFSVRNPFANTQNIKITHARYTAVQLRHAGKPKTDKDYGDLTVAVAEPNALCQEYWYRGGWQDGIATFWRELTEGTLTDRHYDEAGKEDGCAVGTTHTVHRGNSETVRFVLSWNVPNCYNYWNPYKDEHGDDVTWKNHYATRFADSTKTCVYSLRHRNTLYRRSMQFSRALHGTTLDKTVIEAVASTLSVLKSSAVLRLENGAFYGWEGTHELEGSCEGTCTHVWSYVYSLCFLFPELERSLRDTEFAHDVDAHGKQYFRTALPLGRGVVEAPPCVDGQMATVIKIYRDWKLTGDSAWLRENWDNVKHVLEYAWSEHNDYAWDNNKDGVLEGRQHHTLDVEMFGPSAWLQGMYLAALKAAAEMATFVGDADKATEYADLFRKGYAWTRDNLFNGAYFYHKVDLNDRTYTEHFHCPQYWNDETGELKYQIGEGCEIDQLLGQWHANLCGLGDIFDKAQRQTALQTMMKHNHQPSLREFVNVWRLFAMNDEGGTVMCAYPDGARKPAIPISYGEECMTGFEYAFAGLLVSEGFIDEALRVVRAIRHRYDGEKRNPFNEIECGSNYARAMASFALLPAFSGFTFDLPHGRIGFAPRVSGNFRCPFFVGTGWGEFERTSSAHRLTVIRGALSLCELTLGGVGTVTTVTADGVSIPFTQTGETLRFDPITVVSELRAE
ncbi:MAG: hypothetical protein IJO59_00485 [Clostridia bacterium]|nr:hypothetical protein [Clostridia bacterium]